MSNIKRRTKHCVLTTISARAHTPVLFVFFFETPQFHVIHVSYTIGSRLACSTRVELLCGPKFVIVRLLCRRIVRYDVAAQVWSVIVFFPHFFDSKYAASLFIVVIPGV